MFYGSFGTQNTAVACIFRFDPRKGQYNVKIGQIRSNFQSQNFLPITCLSCPASSKNSKNVIYFYVRQLEMPIKILPLNLVCVLYVALQDIVRFFDNTKFWISLAFI